METIRGNTVCIFWDRAEIAHSSSFPIGVEFVKYSIYWETISIITSISIEQTNEEFLFNNLKISNI